MAIKPATGLGNRCRIDVKRVAFLWWTSQAHIEGPRRRRSPKFWARSAEDAEAQAQLWVVQQFAPPGPSSPSYRTAHPGVVIGNDSEYSYYFRYAYFYEAFLDAEGEAFSSSEDGFDGPRVPYEQG